LTCSHFFSESDEPPAEPLAFTLNTQRASTSTIPLARIEALQRAHSMWAPTTPHWRCMSLAEV